MKSVKSVLIVPLLGSFIFQCLHSQELDDIDSQESRLPRYLRDDGVKRVAALTKASFDKTLKHTKLAVVLFYLSSREHPESEKAWKSDEQMLEVVGRVLQPLGVTVGKVNIEQDYDLAQSVGIKFAGSIVIFHQGKKVDYLGHRSADVFISFLHKMFEPPLTIVETKKQRKMFEDIDTRKMVGYFGKGTPQFNAFEEAAKNYQPLIPFFVVTDKKQAKQFRLKKINGIHLHKPFEKAVAFPSDKAITEDSIIEFIEKNKKEILAKIRLEDIHAIWSARVTGFLITAFVRPTTEGTFSFVFPEGAKFFSLVKNLARSFKDNEKLTFVWVDPEPFPMMREYWQKSYKIDVSKPSLGVVDPKMNRSSWLKVKGKEFKLKHMQQWVRNVLENKVEFLTADDNSSTQTQQQQPNSKQEL
ncbi:hypothetical protein QZH41_013007 [Actinostola sp. cb2023]|nr:hypothetical protein QZH41_013007 [Actinostola sp. cb2023]